MWIDEMCGVLSCIPRSHLNGEMSSIEILHAVSTHLTKWGNYLAVIIQEFKGIENLILVAVLGRLSVKEDNEKWKLLNLSSCGGFLILKGTWNIWFL